MKWKAVITKKHLVLASLILILAVAIYLNYVFTGTQTPLVDDGKTRDVAVAGRQEEQQPVHYGDVQQVQASAAPSVYFEEARLNRTIARDQSLTELEGLLNNPDITTADKSAAVAQAAQIAVGIETESRIENLILAKGFSDAIVYLTDTGCSVIVQTNGLLASEAAQIKDIILRETAVSAQNISIVEVN